MLSRDLPPPAYIAAFLPDFHRRLPRFQPKLPATSTARTRERAEDSPRAFTDFTMTKSGLDYIPIARPRSRSGAAAHAAHMKARSMLR
jgi:hypothetical protein